MAYSEVLRKEFFRERLLGGGRSCRIVPILPVSCSDPHHQCRLTADRTPLCRSGGISRLAPLSCGERGLTYT